MNNTELKTEDYPVIRAYLPQTAHELITVCGVETTFQLINKYSGCHITVGKNKTRQGKQLFQDLTDIVGERAAERLTLAYGELRKFYIPNCNAARRYIRNRRMIARFDELTKTMTASKATKILSQEYGVTDRHLWRILKDTI